MGEKVNKHLEKHYKPGIIGLKDIYLSLLDFNIAHCYQFLFYHLPDFLYRLHNRKIAAEKKHQKNRKTEKQLIGKRLLKQVNDSHVLEQYTKMVKIWALAISQGKDMSAFFVQTPFSLTQLSLEQYL
ncbi:hypothetical protein HQ585_08975, partial [candidate division KSB1 bacterium]|nr:hypothetical protein [candidate division KSB1 bacterium]